MPTMYDSIDPTKLPPNGDAYAGYVGGRWPDFAAEQHRFPGKPVLAVAVNIGEDAICLDIEAGDATPAQAPQWFHRQISRGIHKPFLYTAVSAAQVLVNTMAGAGVARGAFWLWTAHYTYNAHLCGPHCGFGFTSTADATQWSDHTPPGCDCSEISQDFLGGISGHAVAPGVPSVPSLSGEDKMTIYTVNKAEFITNGVLYRWLTSAADVNAQVAAGAEPKGEVPNAVPLGFAVDAHSAQMAGDSRGSLIH